jgi:hypothetical protein
MQFANASYERRFLETCCRHYQAQEDTAQTNLRRVGRLASRSGAFVGGQRVRGTEAEEELLNRIAAI